MNFDINENFATGQMLKEARVDRTSGIVHNVTIMNRVSRNGHSYSDKGLEDAVKKFEGVPFYIDHPTKSELRDRGGVRSVRDLAGKVTNVRKVGDSIRADLQLLDKDDVRSLMFAITEMPELAGNSIRATGIGRKDPTTGRMIVDGFKEARSVDLVTEPAATEGLYESRHRGQMDTTTPFDETQLQEFHEQLFGERWRTTVVEAQDRDKAATSIDGEKLLDAGKRLGVL